MLTYILFNTLIYGSIAFALSVYFGYGKYLNVAVGSYMILGTYTIVSIFNNGRSRAYIAIILAMVACYMITNYIILHWFQNEQQRDLFGLIFTIGASILIENITNVIYGPVPVSLHIRSISWIWLATILLIINLIIIYIFHGSLLGRIRKGIYENIGSIRSLGVRANTMLHSLFLILLPGIIAIGTLIANQATLRANDNLFYTLKGLGIMIMVGIGKKEYIYVGALIYVIVEYLLFIQWGLPINYKEALILIVILVILLCKPEGLLSIRTRKV